MVKRNSKRSTELSVVFVKLLFLSCFNGFGKRTFILGSCFFILGISGTLRTFILGF